MSTQIIPRRGLDQRDAGRAAIAPMPRVHRAASTQLTGLYPFLYGRALPPVGPYFGIDTLTGSAFSCHPVEWLRLGLVSNPNLLVTGVPGSGKSATLKVLALRLMSYGVKTFVMGDLKNEYAELARTVGVEPIELGPGLPTRINPLDAGPLGDSIPTDSAAAMDRLAEIHRRRLTLLAALIETRLRRVITPTEENALSEVIRSASGESTGASTLTNPTIPEIWALLRDPGHELVNALRVPDDSTTAAREMVRPVADALGTMVTGSLSGLFDGPTTIRLDFDAPIQTIDLSRLESRGDETVAMILACVSAWGQAVIAADAASDDPPLRLVLRDELWRVLRIAALVRAFDADLRLSRPRGLIEVAATHRLADFEAVGPAGSEEAAIARNVIGSFDTRICLAQDTAPLAATREAIGLTEAECSQISSFTGAHVGRAIWKIGRSFSVAAQLLLTEEERRITETNQRMKA